MFRFVSIFKLYSDLASDSLWEYQIFLNPTSLSMLWKYVKQMPFYDIIYK
jgi:hypothetical protein